MEFPTKDMNTLPLKQRIISIRQTKNSTNSTGSDKNENTGLDFASFSEDLVIFTRYYFSGSKMCSQLIPQLLDSGALEEMATVISNEILDKFPVRKSFRRSVLKEIITYAEKHSLCVPDAIYSAMADSMVDCDDFSYRIYLVPSGTHVQCVIRESNQQLCHGTTGLSVWQASCDLANLMTSYFSFENKNVLELGAGCGLTGISIASRFPSSHVTLSDYDPKVLEQLKANICHLFTKEIAHTPAVLNLDWTDFQLSDIKQLPDVVVAADVVYDRAILPALCQVLSSLLSAKDGVTAFVASTLRDPATLRAFRENLAEHGLSIKDEVRYHGEKFLFNDQSIEAPTMFPFYSTLDSPTIIYQLTVDV